MFKMFITFAFLTLSTSTFAEDLKCSLSVSADPVVDVEFSVAPNTKELFIDTTE